MLGLSVLTAGTLAAGATGTLAWFTTNKTAKATYSKVTAKASTAKIKITIGALSDETVAGGEQTNWDEVNKQWKETASIQGSTNSLTTDISSGDGITFKKPVWKSKAANDAEVASVQDVNKAGESYTQFYIGLENTGSSNVEVFLNQETKIVATDGTKTEDKALAAWTRVAVIDCGETKPTKDNPGESATMKYVFENAGDTENTATLGKYVSGSKGGKLELSTLTGENYKTAGFSIVTEQSQATAAAGYLAPIAQNQTHYYAISVWMEGTENDNQDTANNGSINVTLGFTGLDKIA